MTFKNCITDGVTEGAISQDQANEVLGLFDELETQYNRQMGGAAASAKAAGDTTIVIKKMAIERKRRVALQAQTWKGISNDLASYRNGLGENDKGAAALSLISRDQRTKFNSVEDLQGIIEKSATRKMDKFLATFRRNLVGETRNKAQLKNVVREAFGENTGDASAREMALSWGSANEYLRSRFNAAGGVIAKLDGYGLPQIHSTIKVRLAQFQEWRDYTSSRLNLDKMIDEQTGLRFSPEKLELALKNVYETISTNGFSKVQTGAMMGGRSMANRRQDHRFLIFKNADAWLEYQQKFGESNPFDVMMAHISVMSRDIGIMERLGPNPTATLNFIKQTIKKEAALTKDAKLGDRATKNAAKIDALYGAVTGKNNAPINGFFASTMAGVRQILQAAQLGGAALAATTDINFNRMARAQSGLSQTKTLSQYLKILNPLEAKEKGRLAIRLGLIAEGWSTLASGQARYVGDISGPEITRRISDFVMRASFLSPWTQAGRWAFGMEFLGNLADNAGKTFDQLDPMMRKTMDHYSIGADKWEIMRSTPLYEHEGATFLRAEDIEARTDINPQLARDLATSLMVMIDRETDVAVPSSNVRGRVAITGDVAPGTIAGEMVRSFAMYKSFGVTLMNTHIMRGVVQEGAKAKGRYFADLILSTTLMGALALQLKETAKGRDPRPMTDAEFWGAAMLQGGGLGLFGDFMFSNLNRYDRGLAETIAGPVVGLAGDIKNLTIGNVIEAANGDDTKVASESINFAARYTPGSSLWYVRLAMERMVIDQAKMWVDPKARQKMRRLETNYNKNYGQKYWWRPGKTSPSRAPDPSNILEQRD